MGQELGPTNTDVLIVGAGPAGSTAALALAAYGIRTICLSKYSSTSQSPRAHITNQRTMEILRHFDLENQALALATPQHLMGDNVYCTSLAGRELGRMRAWHTQPRFKAQHDLISPCSIVDLTQDLLEPIIVAAAARNGARIRFDTELLDFEQDEEGITAEVTDRLTGMRSMIRARYMIGADGANSGVVERLGLPLEGRTNVAANIGIGFKADLSRFVAHRPGVLYWMVQPGRGIAGYPIAGLRMVSPWTRWIATWGYDAKGPPPDLSTAEATEIVHRVIGDSSVPVEIERLAPWSMNQVHATSYGKGRVFCMGDAVHRHPPMNGLGTNTSIQDAFNLAWKLALVLQGQAGPDLLASYQDERMPVGHSVVRRAFDNFAIYPPVGEALGFKPGEQRPEQFEALGASLADPSPAGQARRAAFQAALRNNIVGLGALGGEHNHLYRSNAVIEDSETLSVEEPELDVVIGLEAGRRLPHVWVTEGQHRRSTLDLCKRGGFTLLTGVSGWFWVKAAEQVARRLGISLDVEVIGPGERYEDTYGDFADLCLPDETGAILVRPDHHVTWHTRSKPDNPADVLEATLSLVLSRDVNVIDRQATLH